MFETTPIYALAVSGIYLALWVRVAALRGSRNVSIGDGGDPNLLLRIRQHGNCAEWSAFVLILMILAEGSGAPELYLHAAGGLLVIGRLAHPFGLKIDSADHALRYMGNGANIFAALLSMVCLIIGLLDLWGP